jgi:hypothetical protein
VTAQPASRAATDRATSDPTTLVPTATAPADHVTGDHVTARQITEFLGHLAELRVAAGRDDPAQRAAFLARKADLFTRIAAQPARTPAEPPRSRTPPATTPEGRTP